MINSAPARKSKQPKQQKQSQSPLLTHSATSPQTGTRPGPCDARPGSSYRMEEINQIGNDCIINAPIPSRVLVTFPEPPLGFVLRLVGGLALPSFDKRVSRSVAAER